MTDTELFNTLKNGGQINVPYFDGASLPIELDTVTPEKALPALKRFLALSAENRQSDARHLVAYCKMMMNAIGDEEVMEDLGGNYPTDNNIWDYAGPTLLLFTKLDPGKYASRKTIWLNMDSKEVEF